MIKICDMVGVRGGEDGFPVELWRDGQTGRLLLTAYCEAGHNCVEIDLWDVLKWLESGPVIGETYSDSRISSFGIGVPRN